MLWESVFSRSIRESSCIFFVTIIVLTFTISGSSRDILGNTLPNLDFEDDQFPPDNYLHPCEAFFFEYVAAAGNFTHCELLHAKPFRICTKCYEPYAIMKSLYNDLTKDAKLHDCMIKYLKSDRVQIIPTIQKSADSLWDTSSCISCIKNLKVNEKTKVVTYFVPEDVHKFINLYSNISDCLMGNLSSIDTDIDAYIKSSTQSRNISVLCKSCNGKYEELNDHYNSMSNDANGDVCMDVVDMMNYTRVTWSDDLNCSHRSGDAASVVIITLAVAISPFFFYLPLRYTSKEKIKTVLKQKRYEGLVSSASISFADHEGLSGPATSLPPIGS